MNDESNASPIARTVALVLWTGLVGGVLAMNFIVVPKAASAYGAVNLTLPHFTSALFSVAAFTTHYWWAVGGVYLAGVVALGSRALDGVMRGVIVLESIAIAAASTAYLAGIVLPAVR